jgi:hypothetical protein
MNIIGLAGDAGITIMRHIDQGYLIKLPVSRRDDALLPVELLRQNPFMIERIVVQITIYRFLG